MEGFTAWRFHLVEMFLSQASGIYDQHHGNLPGYMNISITHNTSEKKKKKRFGIQLRTLVNV